MPAAVVFCGAFGAPAGYIVPMPSPIWIGVLVGSTIGGFVPELWGGDLLSLWGVLFSGVGGFVGLWLGARARG